MNINNNNNSSILNREDKPLPVQNHSINYEESYRKTNINFRATNRGFSANKQKQNSLITQKPVKDPDVWESPPPMEKRQSVQKVQKASSNVTTNNNPKNLQIRNLPPKKKGGDNNEKKTFMNDRYP
jgi:hypothetical protein